ncbi:SIS domain-containing protein [Tessaracoccus antarcticus]|uniref:Glutamine--fructose-6-phosphate aminotransferase [isomerizing] n=1 Tax=Tessaracoccus antarcticus TaxID=2479848 RepID=A0A3M0GF53_9ACTN|nr:hypothetical protein [Tessaracoccus antarcticus]RMB60213.1 hypothetical protein EAX62_11065 [Tessaracoccus antarcticus]
MDRADYWNTLRDQPQSLAGTTTAVKQALAGAALPPWRAGEVLAVFAMGASTWAAEFLVHEARRRDRVVLNWPAADWRGLSFSPAALAIGISESGRSPETIEALARCAGHRIVITNVAGSPVVAVADTVVPLGSVSDAGVYVSGYTSTLVALALVGESLGLAGLADELESAPRRVGEWVPSVMAAVDGLLSRHYATTSPGSVECVGAGSSFASAGETALLVREAGRLPSACFQTDQYLHGPAEALPGASCCVVFGGGRAVELVQVMVGDGVPVLHISTAPVPGSIGITLPVASPLVTSILEVIVGQVLAGRLGDRRGHEIGTFHHSFAGTKLPTNPSAEG